MGLGGGWGSKQANPEFSCGHSPRRGGVALPASGREDSMMETSQRSTGKNDEGNDAAATDGAPTRCRLLCRLPAASRPHRSPVNRTLALPTSQ